MFISCSHAYADYHQWSFVTLWNLHLTLSDAIHIIPAEHFSLDICTLISITIMGKLLLCLSIALNAFCAGGMFTFPLISPILATHMQLSQPQLTTIVLAGMMSQYPVAVLVGSLIDRHGPSISSLIAALLFSAGFGAFSLEVKNAPADRTIPSEASFYRLTASFLLVGLGTVFSYCSSLFSASKFFPEHIGLASGASMALFGLSPLFLSVIATTFFVDASSDVLNVTSFTAFLAIFTLLIYSSSYLNLRRSQWPPQFDEVKPSPPGETSPLLDNEHNERTGGDGEQPLRPSIRELLRTLDFWLLAFFCVLILGVSEMVISNIGTIVISLPPILAQSPPAISMSGSSVAFQVKLISIANTMARIIVGPLADYLSPVLASQSSIGSPHSRKHTISRFVFLSGSALLLISTFVWTVCAVQTQSQLWALSFGTGFGYSAVFTVLPSLVSSLWGMQDLGRNFGVMMYAPFTGTPLFSYLYAIVSASNVNDESGICKGRSCWQSTFTLSIGTSIVALVLSLVLWNRWRGKI